MSSIPYIDNHHAYDVNWEILESLGFDRHNADHQMISSATIELRPDQLPILKITQFIKTRNKTTKFKIEKI